MQVLHDELETALGLLASDDVEQAVSAFRIIEPAVRSFLRPYLSLVLPGSAIEDVTQEVLIKIWIARRTFRYLGLAAWRGYVRRIACNVAIEWLRGSREEASFDGFDRGEWDRHEDSSELDLLVGTVWFEYDPNLPLRDRDRRVLAAQLHFEEGLPWQKICAAVNGRPATAADRRALDDWLGDPAVLRDLAYRRLHLTGAELVEHLLELNEPCDLFRLAHDSMEQPTEAEVGGGWRQREVLPIIWRFGFGLPVDRIVSDGRNVLPLEELEALFGRCRAKMPFHPLMLDLTAKFGAMSRPVFERQRVFKRLVFEYGLREEMRQKDILDRVQEPASVVGYRLTAAILTMWLSGKRLIEELRRGVTA